MKRCIIHIGMHKTGSTSIQGSLHGFADDQFLYANLGGTPNHSLPIYSIGVANPEKHHLHRAAGRDADAVRNYVAKTRAELRHAIDAAGDRTLIISGEDISVIPPAAVIRLREFFGADGEKITIVGYVRSPAQYISSGFQQRVKGGSALELILDQEYRNYFKTFSKFDDIFGRENVLLWKFDPATFVGGCAVQDFCSRLGIALPPQRIVRLNESLSRQSVSLLFTYRKLGQKYGSRGMKGAESHRLGVVLGTIGNDKFRLAPDIVRPVLERNRADIEWMESRLGQSLEEDLGTGRPGDIQSEADLLMPDPELSKRLIGLLGNSAPEGVTGETPEQVTLLMHCLRRLHGETHLQIPELIAELRESRPELLADLPEGRAAAVVRHVYRQINDALAGTDEGSIGFAGLGQFRVKKVAREIEGRTVTHTQVSFRPAGANEISRPAESQPS